MFELTGKSALVTGGAMGIGKGISLALANQGANLAIADISVEKATETAAEVEKLGRKALVIKCDVTKMEEIDAAVKRILDTSGKIDILVNNVGWDNLMFFSQSTPDFWDRVIDINYRSLLNCTKAVIPHMVSRNYGRIINIGSDAGRVGAVGQAVYSGCKGAVIAFSKTMARELARNKITVNTVCPGPTETPNIQRLRQENKLSARLFASIDDIIPLKRWGNPEDVASAVAFFASDEAGYITGQTLSVSGGITMC